jgi:hypothetical protein
MPERGDHNQAIEITKAKAKPLIKAPRAPHSEPAQISTANATLRAIMKITKA